MNRLKLVFPYLFFGAMIIGVVWSNIRTDPSREQEISATDSRVVDPVCQMDVNVNWDFELLFDSTEKPMGKSISHDDNCIVLPAALATMHGEKVMYETAQIRDYIGVWVNPEDYVSWDFSVEEDSNYLVEMTIGCATGQEGSTYAVEVGEAKLTGKVRETGNWRTFTIEQLGTLELNAGQQTLIVRPVEIAQNALMNIKRIKLRPKK